MNYETDPLRVQKITDNVRTAVRLSRGWWQRIAKETGCRRQTLVRFSAEDSYDPPASELAKIDSWFVVHGIPRKGPSRQSGYAAPVGSKQMDIEDMTGRADG